MTSTNNQATKPVGGKVRCPKLVVYRASAGSGKTFTLAVEYIALLMNNPEAYRNILAVTFTNKATAEMKERILSQLYGISKGLPDSKDYLAAIKEKTKLTDADIRKRADDALNHIIHDYSRFHVETIDTFSVSVMRNLAKELNVGTNMNIELNSDDVLSETVDTMIEGLSQGTDVLNWLTNYIMESIEDDRSWKRVFKSVKKFGGQIFNEQFVENGEKLREQLKNPKCIDAYKDRFTADKKKIEADLKLFADDFFDVLERNHIAPEQLCGGKNSSVPPYFRKLQDGDISKVNFGATLEKLKTDAEKWAVKTSPCRDDVIALAKSDLMRILNDAEDYRSQHIQKYNSYCLSLEYINELRLLAEIDEQMEHLNQMNNRYLLAGINKLLRSMIKDSDTPFVFEKLGTTFSNIMMDEFQDTSCVQWKNFSPLINEGLANGNDSLIVGDVKQSIYRWRNSDWSLLNNIEDDENIKGKKSPVSLDTNFRSEKNIVDFNNKFFEAAKDNLAKRCEAMGIEGTALKTAYKNVTQTNKKTDERGYVKVTFIDTPSKSKNQNEDRQAEEDEDYEDITIKLLYEQVSKLTDEVKVAPKEIAILVRKKKHIKEIAEYFSKKGNGIKLVSDEAFRLDASVAVNIIVNALRCLSLSDLRDKKSKTLLAPLAIDYQQEVVHGGDEIKVDEIVRLTAGEILDRHLPEPFSAHTDELRLLPLCELVERLYAIFSLDKIPEQEGYLCAFFDAVSDYSSTHPSELSDFIAYWDETLFKKTLPVGDVDGIRILTIHKAKGLEYHTVLVPFCDWTLSVENHADNPHKVWCKTGENEPFNALDLLPINYKKEMKTSIYDGDYEREMLQLMVDNLNLLYVAFTRAKENLFVWGKWHEKWNEQMKEKEGKKSETEEEKQERMKKKRNEHFQELTNISKLLMESLQSLAELKSGTGKDNEDLCIYERGTLLPPKDKTEKSETNILLVKPEPRDVEMHPMQGIYHFRQSNRSAAFISGKSKAHDYIDRGNVLHDFFSRISTTADVRSAAEQLVEDGVIADDKQQTKVHRLTDFALRVLDGIQDKHWFDASWHLFNECTIIYKEEGHIETCRPDRVMMKDGEVVVLDYKFAQKNAEYNDQVRHYINLMKRMGHRNVKGYLWYFDINNNTNELEEVNNG